MDNIFSAPLHNMGPSQTKPTIHPTRDSWQILGLDCAITGVNSSILSNVNISILDPVMKFQMFHELKLRKA
jgi:hypothetical protein